MKKKECEHLKQEQLLSDVTGCLPEGFILKTESTKNKESDYRAELTGPHGETADFALEIKQIHRKETLMAVREKMARLALK